jgi:hypothetical protein
MFGPGKIFGCELDIPKTNPGREVRF